MKNKIFQEVLIGHKYLIIIVVEKSTLRTIIRSTLFNQIKDLPSIILSRKFQLTVASEHNWCWSNKVTIDNNFNTRALPSSILNSRANYYSNICIQVRVQELVYQNINISKNWTIELFWWIFLDFSPLRFFTIEWNATRSGSLRILSRLRTLTFCFWNPLNVEVGDCWENKTK